MVHVWLATEEAGGRKRGDTVVVDPNPLLAGSVQLDDKAIVPSLPGFLEGCAVKKIAQNEAVN